MAYIYDLTDTWSAGGTVFNAIKMNVTDSASAVTSKLVSLQTNGTEHFSVTKAGAGYFSGSVGIGITPLANTRISVRTATVTDTAYYADNGVDSGFKVKFASSLTSILNDFGADLVLGTNDTERMRIDAAGAVGIGTASPATKLDVAGAITSRGSTNPYLALNNGTATSYVQVTSGTLDVRVGGANPITFNTNSAERMRIDSSGNVLINRSSESGLGKLNVEGGADFTGGNVLMCRDTGNVGIGTSSPGSKLDVVGDFRTTGIATLGMSATTTIATIGDSGTANTRIIQFARASAVTDIVNIQGINAGVGAADISLQASGGNVGIGTSSPLVKLDVDGSINARSGTITADNFVNWGSNLVIDAGGSLPIIFKNNGTESARIINGGNVGIGTSSPATKLDVNGDVTVRNGSGVILGNIQNNGGWFDFSGSANVSGAQISTTIATPIRFNTNGSERMRIDSSGNLLVGTTSSAYSSSGRGVFEINGSSNSIVSLKSGGNTTGYLYASYPDFFVANSASGPTIFENGGSEKMRLTAAGNLGIGTNNPTAKITVYNSGSSDAAVRIGNAQNGLTTDVGKQGATGYGATSAGDGFLYSSGILSIMADNGSGVIKFSAGGNTERARIASNGCVNIGGTGSDATLMVSAGLGGFDRLTQMSPNTASKNAFNIMSARNSSNADLWWSWGVRNDSVWALQEGVNYSLNGSLGFYYDGAGQAFKSGGGTWASTSDVRVKTNIAPISDAASRIMALKPSSFDYRMPEAHQGRVSDRGFIAQEFEKVYPHSVSESAMVAEAEKVFIAGGDKIKAIGLKTDFFADLVALVQEQQTTIQELTARVAQLEGN